MRIHAGDSELGASELDGWARKLPHNRKLAECGNGDWGLTICEAAVKRSPPARLDGYDSKA